MSIVSEEILICPGCDQSHGQQSGEIAGMLCGMGAKHHLNRRFWCRGPVWGIRTWSTSAASSFSATSLVVSSYIHSCPPSLSFRIYIEKLRFSLGYDCFCVVDCKRTLISRWSNCVRPASKYGCLPVCLSDFADHHHHQPGSKETKLRPPSTLVLLRVTCLIMLFAPPFPYFFRSITAS